MSQPNLIKDVIDYLREAPITYEEILKKEPLEKLISDKDVQNALQEARERYFKWLDKTIIRRGFQIQMETKQKTCLGFMVNCLLDIVIRKILDYYGIRFEGRLAFKGLGYAVGKKAKKFSSKALETQIRALIDFYKATRDLDEEKARIVALASAKCVKWAESEFRGVIFKEIKEEAEEYTQEEEMEEEKEAKEEAEQG